MNKLKTFFKVKNKKYSSFGKILIIAEIGSNHNNNFHLLEKLIKIAKKSGCDAVKFQLFKAKNLVSKNTKAYKILKNLELSNNWIPRIRRLCTKYKILFACSPFDENAVEILKKNKCDIIKIASPEIKNLYLIKKAANAKIPLVISTGDSDKKIIARSLKIIKKSSIQPSSVAYLHCTSEYPTKINNVNLNMLKFLTNYLKKYSIGFSDHSLGIDNSVAAVALGACIIEKHITLSKKLKGPDHHFALEPNELTQLVNKIKNLCQSFGHLEKKRLAAENTIYISAFAKEFIKKNTTIEFKKIIFKRSKVKGFEIHNIKKILNKNAKKNYMIDDQII